MTQPTDFSEYIRSLGPSNAIGYEAACLKCGEHFNPSGEEIVTPEGHIEHYATSDGKECGGFGPLLGSWQ